MNFKFAENMLPDQQKEELEDLLVCLGMLKDHSQWFAQNLFSVYEPTLRYTFGNEEALMNTVNGVIQNKSQKLSNMLYYWKNWQNHRLLTPPYAIAAFEAMGRTIAMASSWMDHIAEFYEAGGWKKPCWSANLCRAVLGLDERQLDLWLGMTKLERGQLDYTKWREESTLIADVSGSNRWMVDNTTVIAGDTLTGTIRTGGVMNSTTTRNITVNIANNTVHIPVNTPADWPWPNRRGTQ